MTRITQQQLESYLWGAAVLLRGTIDAGDYKQFIFPLLFYKRLCDVFDEETVTALKDSGGDENFAMFPENHRFQVPADAHWREIRKVSRNVGRGLQQAMRAIETANPDKLFGIFGDAQWTNKDRLSDAMLRDLIEHFSTLELTVANLPEDELGQGYEYLIKKFADDSGHTAAEFYTNRTVVHLMTEMLDVQPGESVYDPTCGSGGMLLSCIAHLRNQKKEWRNVKLYGQERNLMTSSIARMNCFLHGIEDFRIERGDTLAEPKLVEGDRLQRFDVVLANPPYSIKQWNREAFAADPWGRNLFGVPPQGRADYAFQQHILQSLKPKTGRCAVLWPHGILFRNEEDEIRRKMIESDLIEAIIGLGPNLFYNSSMQSCIVICRTNKPRNEKNKILFIDAVNEVTRERTQSFLTRAHIDRVVQALRTFNTEEGFAKAATLEEIKDNQWSLNIPLYVQTAATKTLVQTDTGNTSGNAVFDAWLYSRSALRNGLAKVVPEISEPHSTETLKPDVVTALARFERTKWKKATLGDVCDEISVRIDNPASLGNARFVGLEHFDSGNLKICRWGSTENLGSAMKEFSSGDVLFARRNAYLKRASLADFDGVCSGDAIVLRERHEAIVPGFLAFLLNTNRFWEFAIANAAGTMSRRVNGKTLMRFEFDLPPLDQQRRIAEILWAVDAEWNCYLGVKDALEDFRKSLFGNRLSGFAVKPLSEVVDFLDGKRVPLSEKERAKRKGPYPYYGASGVIDSVDGYIFDEPLVLLSEDGFNLVNRNSRIAFKVDGKVWINNHAHVLRPKAGMHIDFLADYLESVSLEPFITGTYQRKLNKSECERIPVPVPPSEIQGEIAETIARIVRSISAIETKVTHSKSLVAELLNCLS
jgi:type I restriction enzyme M protein